MSSTGDNVEQIVITADATDLYQELLKSQAALKSFTAEVKASAGTLDSNAFAGAVAALANVKTATAALTTQVAGLAPVGQATFATLQQGIDTSLGLDRGLASAAASAKIFSTSMATAGVSATEAALGETAAGTAAVGATSAMGGLRIGTAGVIQEFVRMGRAIATGQWERLPSEAVTATSRMGGLQTVVAGLGATGLITAASVIALAAGIGIMLYQSIEAEKELNELTARQGLFGNATSKTKAFIESQRDALDDMSGVSSKTAKAILELENSEASFSAQLQADITQVTPAFVQAYGTDAPAALKKVVDAAADLSLNGLQKLSSDTLKLTATQYEMIAQLVSTGQKAQATEAILSIIGDRSGHSLETLNQTIRSTEQEIQRLKDAGADDPTALEGGAQEAGRALVDLEQKLAAYKVEAAAADPVAEQLNADREAAEQASTSTRTYTGLLIKLREAEGDVAALKATGAPGAELAQYQALLTQQQAAFDKYNADETSKADAAAMKTFTAWKTTEDAKMEAFKTGSAERISILQTELAAASALGEKGAEDAARIQGQINSERREATTQRTADAKHEQDEWVAGEEKAVGSVTAMDRDYLTTAFSVARDKLDAVKDGLQAEVDANQITNSQKIALLRQYETASVNLQISELQAQASSSDTSLEEYASLYNRISALRQGLTTTLASLDLQDAANSKKNLQTQVVDWKSAISQIDNAENTLVSGIFSGRQNLAQSVGKVVESAAEKEIEDDLHLLTQHLLLNTQQLASDKATAQGGFLWQLLFGNQATEAAEAAATAKQTATAAANAASLTQTAGYATGVVTIDSGVAAAGAFADSASLGPAGLAAAPGVAASAKAATLALGLPKFDQGALDVPQDMVAQIHEGEAVLPASFASALRASISGGGQSGGGGNTYSISISAVDAGSVRQLFTQQGSALVQSLQNQMRLNNPGLTRAGVPS